MIVGLGLTLYFLSRAVRSMMRTVNDIYHVEIHKKAEGSRIPERAEIRKQWRRFFGNFANT